MTTPDKPDDNEGGFLGRWSRRKLAPEPGISPPPPADNAPAEPDTRPRDPETGEVIDEDLVSRLPKVDELQAGGDVSAFMQKGVPEALRREALRTMWLNDPMIRNYVSPALDYAYDYNAPGGAPGYGPLTESDMAQAREFLANVFSTPQKAPDAADSAADSGSRDNESHIVAEDQPLTVRLSDAAMQHGSEVDVAADIPEGPHKAADISKLPQSGEVPIVQRGMTQSDDEPVTSQRRRRGGGAAPT